MPYDVCEVRDVLDELDFNLYYDNVYKMYVKSIFV